MKNNNYYLKSIANKTGSELSKMKNKISYLRSIANNTGSSITDLKNENYLLREIDSNISSIVFKGSNHISCIGDKDLMTVGDNLTVKAQVVLDDANASGKTVNFYVED